MTILLALGWLAVSPLGVTATSESPPASLSDPPRYTEGMPPIGVAVTSDGLAANGLWSQTVRLTVKAGGTLDDASVVAFGDHEHVDAIFAAARQGDPSLTSPALIPLDQEINLTIDPSTRFVLATVDRQANALVQTFTNGVVDTLYDKPVGCLVRVITFPSGKPTKAFFYPSANGSVKVRPGGKLVEVAYAPGESYGDVVKQIYGVTTYSATADLRGQTHWGPDSWPPKPRETYRIVVGPVATYLVTPTEAAVIPNAEPIGRERQERLRAARLGVGITMVGRQTFGQTYHVAVNDPTITASAVSQLLYGTEAHRPGIVAAAGIRAPAAVAGFDPPLLGRAFDLTIDYVDENFMVKRSVLANANVVVELADGASVVTYPPSTSGPMRIVQYPSGYKRVLYRPTRILLTAAHALALFHSANNLALASSQVDPLNRRYAAEVIWRFGSSVPRQSGELTDSLALVDDPRGAYVDALIAPPLPRSRLQQLFDFLDPNNPFPSIAFLVVAATGIIVFVEAGRRIGARRRPRW